MKSSRLIIGVGIGFVLYLVVLSVFNKNWRAGGIEYLQ